MAFRYFFVSISDVELLPLVETFDEASEASEALLGRDGNRYRVFVDFDGFKTDVLDPPQAFPCAWRGENMSFVYNTSEVNALHDKTLLLVCRGYRKLLSDRDLGRVEIDLHTLMTGPRNVELKLMTEAPEFELEPSSDEEEDSDDSSNDSDSSLDEPTHNSRRRQQTQFQPQELCRVRFRIVIRQLCSDIQFGVDNLDITAVCRRLQNLTAPAHRPVVLRIATGYIDPDVLQWSHAPQRLNFDKVLRRLREGNDKVVHAHNALIYLMQRVPVTHFIRGTIHIVFTVETETHEEYEAGRLVIPVLGNYDFFQKRITLVQRVLWSDTVLDALDQFQMVLRDECTAMFSVTNGPLAIQMSKGRLTEHGVQGNYYVGFPMPDSKHLDPRVQLGSTYTVKETMHTIWEQYLKDASYSQVPDWIFKCRPNPILAERGHLLPTDDGDDNDENNKSKTTSKTIKALGSPDGKPRGSSSSSSSSSSSTTTTTLLSPGHMSVETVLTHLTVETYLQQLLRVFRRTKSTWQARDVELRQEFALAPSHALSRTYLVERSQAEQQLYWLRVQVEAFLDLLAARGTR
jgi:hypothetical protein